MRCCDPDDRAVEIVETLVRDDRRDFCTPAAEPRILLHGEEPARLPYLAENASGVERHQAAHVDDGRIDVHRIEPLRGLHRLGDHGSQRDNGAMLALPQHFRRAQRLDMLAVGHLALGAVERLLLEEQHRVRVANGRRQQALGVGRI